jgi:protein-tyrosine phosphatase
LKDILTGVSRSATIVLAYLMKYHHNTLKEAYLYLAEKRPQICPNEGFLIQLIRYEDELIQSREIKPNDENSSVTNEENPIETLNEFETKHETDNQ